jgi:hypothetical protein
MNRRTRMPNTNDDFRAVFAGALGGGSTHQAAKRLGWLAPDSAGDHGGRIDAAPDNEPAQPVRATDPSQGRGNFGETPKSPEHEFREMMDSVLGPQGMIKRGPIKAFEAGPDGLRRNY